MNIFRISSQVLCNFIFILTLGIPGHNPGPFTLDGTNTFLVGTGMHRLLIDTGQGISEYKASLLEALESTNTKSVDILITHGHGDHIGGIDQVRELMMDHFNQALVKVYKRKSPEEYSTEYLPIDDGQLISVDGATLQAIATPGHTFDHTCFMLKDCHALFSGDCILGKGSTVFESLVDYMKSLEKLKSITPSKIYPGHGPMIDDAIKKIDEYIHHRKEREREILSLIKDTPLDVTSIVSKMYMGYPESVRNAALHNTMLHLEKLLIEKRVLLVDGMYHHCT